MKHLIILLATTLFFSQCQQAPKAPEVPDVPSAPDLVEAVTAPFEKSEDYLAIEGVIQNYFDGWLTGDSSLVGSAMHASCNLKFVREGKIGRRDRTQYLSGFKPRPRLENSEGRILSIDITRTAAEAKIELETPERLFTDYFNLLKEGDRWYITDKVSTSLAKTE